jgi:hypothetical protein
MMFVYIRLQGYLPASVRRTGGASCFWAFHTHAAESRQAFGKAQNSVPRKGQFYAPALQQDVMGFTLDWSKYPTPCRG